MSANRGDAAAAAADNDNDNNDDDDDDGDDDKKDDGDDNTQQKRQRGDNKRTHQSMMCRQRGINETQKPLAGEPSRGKKIGLGLILFESQMGLTATALKECCQLFSCQL